MQTNPADAARIAELELMLEKIVQRASGRFADSTGQNMRSLRESLLDQAVELLGKRRV